MIGCALALVAACDPSTPRPLCQVPGLLGAGAFTAHDCRHEDGCLDGWRFAANTVETLVFCPGHGEEVTAVTSSDPSVMVVRAPIDVGGTVEFDVAAGGPGRATLEVRGPALREQLELVVEDIAGLTIDAPARVVVGGRAAVTSTKLGGSGAPMFGRGGYGLTLPTGLSARPATTATQDCELAQPDLVLGGDALGSYQVTTTAPAPSWTTTVDVVPAATVRSVQFVATRIAGAAATGYAASVRTIGFDADGRPVQGVACAWTASRPVFIAANVCWALVLMSTDEPLELSCRFDGRDLGTVRLSNVLTI